MKHFYETAFGVCVFLGFYCQGPSSTGWLCAAAWFGWCYLQWAKNEDRKRRLGQ